ncbi:Replication factor C (RF-C) subunit [Gurleya vavrai]
MLIHTEFTPKTLSSLNHHKYLTTLLSTYNTTNIPHLLFHGPSGSSKKTLIHALLNDLFGPSIISLKTSSIKTTKEIPITYLETSNYIEITPSDYNFNDKAVIQHLIKEVAQTKNILGLVKKVSELKFIIVNEADYMSRDAQAALRRTVEKYSKNFRIIIVCEEISSIMEALRSRCLCLRVRGFDDNEILINNNSITDDILKKSHGNMRKALCLAEICNDGKKKVELEYERIIQGIANLIIQKQDGNVVLLVRKEIVLLLNSCIPAKVILKELVRKLLVKSKDEKFFKICEYALMYEERLVLGNKDILHLEGFVVSVMCLFYK